MPATDRRSGRPSLACGGAVPRLPRLPPGSGSIQLPTHVGDNLTLARALVRCGIAGPGDLDPLQPDPGAFVQKALLRSLAPYLRRAGDLGITVRVMPWRTYLLEFFCDSDTLRTDPRWVAVIQVEATHALAVEPVIRALGRKTGAALLSLVMTHSPLYANEGSELEWIIDGWRDCIPEDDSDREILRRGIRGQQELAQIEALLHEGAAARARGRTRPPRDVRRAAAVFEALGRKPSRPNSDQQAWDDLEDVEWSLPRPAIQLIWKAEGALDHAALQDEEYRMAGDQGQEPPDRIVLLDPGDPERLRDAWNSVIHTVRHTRATNRLLRRIEQNAAPPSPLR